jgi:hypothetical protein
MIAGAWQKLIDARNPRFMRANIYPPLIEKSR